MSKVIPIRGGGVVKLLEEILETARSGEIDSLAIVYITKNHEVAEGWCGAFDLDVFRMYGAINSLRDCFFHEEIDHNGIADLER